MKIQKLFENWREFKKDVLLEMASYERAGYIEDATDHLGPEDVPFNDIFKALWLYILLWIILAIMTLKEIFFS